MTQPFGRTLLLGFRLAFTILQGNVMQSITRRIKAASNPESPDRKTTRDGGGMQIATGDSVSHLWDVLRKSFEYVHDITK
jgi:hypothetical protein